RVRPKRLDAAAIEALGRHAWPGNVRELRNVMERVAILVPGDVVSVEALGLSGGVADAAVAPDGEGGGSLAERLERYQRASVLPALERTRWRMTKTAEELQLERSHLYKKLKALGIERPVED